METGLSEKCFHDFVKLIHELTGISIAANRTSMLEGRLRRRVAEKGLTRYEDYLNVVREDKKEQILFIDLVTTNETYFFRTPRIWDYIENKFLPKWRAENPKQTLRVWSAAASSGEEAHSVAVLCQSLKQKDPSFNYQIFGTDISQEMVALCERGRYRGRAIESFKNSRAELFRLHMKAIGEDVFEASGEIRSRLRFQTHNLFQKLNSQGPFDLILLRNVLIYFKGEDQEKVLAQIAPTLAPGGQLIIGESESLSHISSGFQQIEPLIYRKAG